MRLFGPSLVRPFAIATTLAVAGLLVGCGADDDKKNASADTKQSGSKAAKSTSSGTIQIGDRTITFTPDICMKSGSDSLVSGPGKDSDGTPVYVGLDATSPTEGELRIDLGTDQKFSSSDEILRAATDNSNFLVEPTTDGLTATGEFTDGNNSPVGAGTMVVTCP